MRTLRTMAFAIALAIVLLAAAAPAQAQRVDLSKTTCQEFLESGRDGIMIIWSWLYGYFADQDADPVVDFDDLTKKGQALGEACKANPTNDVISAAEPIYEKK